VSESGTDYQIYATCTSNMYSFTWARSGAILTVTKVAHGLSNGDIVVVRNVNEDYVVGAISGVTTDTFALTVSNSGTSTGTAGQYGSLFTATVTQSSGDVTAVAINAPAGLSGASQLNGLSIYANNQESGLALTLPAGLTEGAGGYSDKENINISSVDAKSFSGTGVSGALSPVATYNLGANFNRIDISNIDNFTPVMLSVRF
jgi:hypothetical protein